MPLSDLITQVKPAAKDDRRVIYEISVLDLVKISGFLAARTQDFSITNAGPLGNHYHLKAEEFFLITSGEEVQLFLEDIDTKERLEVLVGEGNLVHVPPKVAHAFRFTKGKGTMIGFVNLPVFDPEDMPAYKIMGPSGESISV